MLLLLTKGHTFLFRCLSRTFVLDAGHYTFHIIVTLDSGSVRIVITVLFVCLFSNLL